MSLRPIRTVFRKELIDSLRDRRTLISMIVVPVLLMPLLLLGMGLITAKTVRKVQQEIPRVMVLGGQDSPRLTARLKALKTISVTAPSNDFTNRISDRQIQAAVDVPLGFDHWQYIGLILLSSSVYAAVALAAAAKLFQREEVLFRV